MIRPATPADSALLAQLHSANFPRGWSRSEFDSFFARSGIAAYLAMLDEPHCASSETDSQAIGFIFCWLVAGECELLSLAVNEAARGQGIARKLCEQMLVHAKTHRASMMHLEVATSNRPAIGLYQSLGFSISHRRKDYYQQADGTREDALTMQLVL